MPPSLRYGVTYWRRHALTGARCDMMKTAKMLKDKGIATIVPVGVTSHNGVLFTSVDAALRGFNVVVPVDGMAGNNAYEDQAAAYTLTSSIVYKVTLTSIDTMKF
jgi:nicotinamidase-related amidase